ncbi:MULTISPECIES: hypothetical protein [unclassified Streptomyces]|uniref:hypothetical protein n=1 Tax=unclassified Streptomyces TaxID=2593676 RepID=UPI00381DD453
MILLQADRLPSGVEPKQLWPWWSSTCATAREVDPVRQAFLPPPDQQRRGFTTKLTVTTRRLTRKGPATNWSKRPEW